MRNTQCGYKVSGLILLKWYRVALSMCDKQEHVDRSLPNEDTKFQCCTIKHRVAGKCFRKRSFR